MEIQQFKNLLYQVNAITSRYQKINELTGENFNVFRILKLEASEVRMHSAFLAELLDPDGSHGQKDIFLNLFIKSFCFKENLIDAPSCKVKVEENIGIISEDKTRGGRIDIVITDKDRHQIIIENKIYASDQNHQLVRYYNHSKDADIIYLTLYGKSPGDKSKGDLMEGKDFKCFSYQNDVLAWLQLCRKEVTVYPIVREGITHYINSIKYLTNQTLNQNMKEELSDLIKSNIEASFLIFDNLDDACEKISKGFGEKLIKECENIGLNCYYSVDFNSRNSGIWINKPEWKYVNIGFGFANYDKELQYGIVLQGDLKNSSIPIFLRDQLNKLFGNSVKINNWWPWYQKMEEPFDNWGKFQAWRSIIDGRMGETILDKVKNLLEVTKTFEM